MSFEELYICNRNINFNINLETNPVHLTMSNKQINLEDTDRIDQLNYEPLEPKYIKVQFISTILTYLILLALPFFFLLTEDFNYQTELMIITECVILLAGVINLWFLPKAYAYKGFAIREHDITYRSGIIFPSTVTIPFCKIQQVSIQQNPIGRIFKLYSVDIVNGAQLLAETNIPGLTEERANKIKTLLVERVKDEK